MVSGQVQMKIAMSNFKNTRKFQNTILILSNQFTALIYNI
jgi:hypothetical protein